MKSPYKLLLAAAALAVSVSASADTLVDWNFGVFASPRNGWTTNTLWNSTWTGHSDAFLMNGSTEATVLSGVNLGNMLGNSPGVPIGSSGLTGINYSTASTQATGDLNLSNFANSATKTNWIYFSVGADASHNLNLATIQFTGWRNGANAAGTMSFDYSSNGGTSWTTFGADQAVAGTGIANVANLNFNDSVNVLAGSSVLIRFSPYGGNGSGNIHINDINVLGTVTAVPEPSTYGLMGAGALAAAAIVRRRRKHAGKAA